MPSTPKVVTEQIREALASAEGPMRLTALRRACRVRSQRLADGLAALVAEGRAEKTPTSYRLRP